MTLVLSMMLRMQMRFVSAPWQERTTLQIDARLMDAAQYRANDMAFTHHFSHESPRGMWPNRVVRACGYKLPEHWPDDANYIESIGKGFRTPEGFLEACYASLPHRPHVTGNVKFFFDQQVFGVGYSIEIGSDYPTPYYVLITAPREPGSFNLHLPYVSK